jgi:hypothetical protein
VSWRNPAFAFAQRSGDLFIVTRALMGFGNIQAGPFLDLVEVKLKP